MYDNLTLEVVKVKVTCPCKLRERDRVRDEVRPLRLSLDKTFLNLPEDARPWVPGWSRKYLYPVLWP